MLTLTEQLQRAVRQNPNATAVIDQHQTDTWVAFGARVMRIAEALTAAGVAPGDRVTVLAGNSCDYLACYFAIPWVGAITLPLNSRLSQSEMEYILQDADANLPLLGGLQKLQVAHCHGQSAKLVVLKVYRLQLAALEQAFGPMPCPQVLHIQHRKQRQTVFGMVR